MTCSAYFQIIEYSDILDMPQATNFTIMEAYLHFASLSIFHFYCVEYRCLNGKNPCFLFNWSLFESRNYNCTWLVHVGLKNEQMHGRGERANGYAVRHNERGVWLYNQLPCHRISDFFSSATNSLLRWLFADAGIRRWNTSSSRIRTSRSDQLQTMSSPAAIRRRSKEPH